MSKSLGNGIPPDYLVSKYGADPARYFLLRELPFGSDGDFSHRAVVGRLNGDLANDFGNLAQRVLVMIGRYCDARVPEPGMLDAADETLLDAARGLFSHDSGHEAALEILRNEGTDHDRHRITQAQQRARYEARRARQPAED